MSPVRSVVVLAPADVESAVLQAVGEHKDTLEVVRRCADIAEVLAASRSRVAQLACLDASDPDLDAGLIEELHRYGTRVVLLADPTRIQSLRSLGADAVVPEGATDQIVEALLAIVRLDTHRRVQGTGFRANAQVDPLHPPSATPDLVGFPSLDHSLPIGFTPTGGTGMPALASAPGLAPPASPPKARVIAVWGTSGAPGRSTTALALGRALSKLGHCLIIDADTTNPSLAHMCAVPVEPSGIAALARIASRGLLTVTDLQRTAVNLSPTLHLLTGLSAPQRWREVGPTAIAQILQSAREAASYVVVDLAATALEPLQEAGRNLGDRDDVATQVLATAHTVVMVGRGDAIGIHRLSLTHKWWVEQGIEARLEILVNRCSSASAGPRWVNAVRSSLSPFLAGRNVHLVPEDAKVLSSVLHGRLLQDHAPRSEAAKAFDALADSVHARLPAGRRRPRRTPVGH